MDHSSTTTNKRVNEKKLQRTDQEQFIAAF